MKKVYFLFFFFLFSLIRADAQDTIVVKGCLYDDDTSFVLPQSMVINKRNNNGTFTDNSGKFSIRIIKTDTLYFYSYGYQPLQVCFKDSVVLSNRNFRIKLKKLEYTLKEVVIVSTRNLNEIEKDIKKIPTTPTYTTSGLDAVTSPITYLYERFSKFGKSQMKVAKWESEDRKRELLKELFRLYIKYDVMELSNDEFDAFIKYINLSDDFIKTATQLELVLAIQGKYESYINRWK